MIWIRNESVSSSILGISVAWSNEWTSVRIMLDIVDIVALLTDYYSTISKPDCYGHSGKCESPQELTKLYCTYAFQKINNFLTAILAEDPENKITWGRGSVL